MSEANTQTSPNLTTTASANDAVFSEISRKEVLSILK